MNSQPALNLAGCPSHASALNPARQTVVQTLCLREKEKGLSYFKVSNLIY